MKKLISAVLAVIMLLSVSITAFAVKMPSTWSEEKNYLYVSFDKDIPDSSVTRDTSDIYGFEDDGYYYAVGHDSTFTVENRAPKGGNDYIAVVVTLYTKITAEAAANRSDGEYEWVPGTYCAYADFVLQKDGTYFFDDSEEGWMNLDLDTILTLKPGESKTFTLENLQESFEDIYGQTLKDSDYFFVVEPQHDYPDEGEYWYTKYLFQFNESVVAQKRADAATAVKETGFTDISADAYYYDAVKWAKENNITTGTSATTFGPYSTCNRGQVVTFLWRAKGCPEPTTTVNPFKDVKESDYYYKAVLWAVEQGITAGTSATTFAPNATCSNAHILTFLWRAMGKPASANGSNWYSEAENWAKANSLLTDTDAASDITGDCPRSDVVTFLYRELAK